jgi:SPP1 family predicted phage head-tail adaptor
LVIKAPVEARDGFGDVVTTWSRVATVWGSIEPMYGREFLQARQVQAEDTTRIRIRYRADVRPSWRIEEAGGGASWDIKTITYDERRTQCELMCMDVVEDA